MKQYRSLVSDKTSGRWFTLTDQIHHHKESAEKEIHFDGGFHDHCTAGQYKIQSREVSDWEDETV